MTISTLYINHNYVGQPLTISILEEFHSFFQRLIKFYRQFKLYFKNKKNLPLLRFKGHISSNTCLQSELLLTVELITPKTKTTLTSFLRSSPEMFMYLQLDFDKN